MSCKVIRIGVFFDGTGNNLTNDQAANKASNIAKLYQLYSPLYQAGSAPDTCPFLIGQRASECKIITTAVYIEGLGTQANQPDNLTGLGMGSGGAKRIQLAISQIRKIRQQFRKEEYKCYIDVFGFSRGAALARDFMGTMYEKYSELTFSFKFIGLFDTVASFGKAGDNKNYKPITDKGSEGWTFWHETLGITPSTKKYEPYNFNLAPHSAEQIVHLVALDEYRENFPLTDTEGAGRTYYLIGAHSDVGGGYEPMTVERLFKYALQKPRQAALAPLPPPTNGIAIGENWHADWVNYQEVEPTYEGNKNILKYTGQRTVSNDLQQIGLIMMYNLAVKAGVPLLPFSLTMDGALQAKLIRQIAYTPYQPTTQALNRHSPALAPLLGNGSSWSETLKAYCITAIEDPAGLNQALGHHTTFAYPDSPAQDSVFHHRQPDHLRILAQYAHNSACTPEAHGLNPPPIGFKHRQTAYLGESISNSAYYLNPQNPPVRVVWRNQAALAVVNEE